MRQNMKTIEIFLQGEQILRQKSERELVLNELDNFLKNSIFLYLQSSKF